jgi:hypothetical protein
MVAPYVKKISYVRLNSLFYYFKNYLFYAIIFETYNYSDTKVKEIMVNL